MRNRAHVFLDDIEECKIDIQSVLDKYNCKLIDGDEGDYVLIYDNDTKETISATK